MKDSYRLNLKKGSVIKVKRKPTTDNNATEVFRTVKEIDFKKKTILCDDNIIYKFKDLL
jgi:hypothetical protein